MQIAENIPPNAEEHIAIISAFLASPLRAIGRPSKVVAAFDGVPGIPSKIAVMLPPVMDEQYTLIKKDIAKYGDNPYVKVAHRITAMLELTPGRAPKKTPSRVPKNKYAILIS